MVKEATTMYAIQSSDGDFYDFIKGWVQNKTVGCAKPYEVCLEMKHAIERKSPEYKPKIVTI